MANYREPQWLLPNEKNLAMPASDATVGSGLAEDRQSLYSMDFDGTDDYVSTSASSVGIDFSFSCWIKHSGNFSANYKDIAFHSLVTTNILKGGFYLYHSTGSNLVLRCDLDATRGTTQLGTGWNHVAGVFNNTTKSLVYYLNGQPEISMTLPAYALISRDLYLGGVISGYNNAGYDLFNGLIDEYAFWTRMLPVSEITTLYNSGVPGNLMAVDNKPYAYYPLGEQARLGSEWQFPNEVLQSQVVDFDGSTDYISAGSLSYITSNVFTISGWIKATTSPPTYMPLFNFQNSSGIGSKFGWNHGAAPILWYSGSTYKYFLSGSWRTDGLWHNVVLVIDRTTIGNSKLYVDGDEISGGTTGGSGSMVLNDLYLGYNPTTQFYDGEMSNVAIWNSDQTANIANIYNNGSPQSTYTATPTAWWKLNAANSSYDTATSTWTFTDSSGTNDGTSTTLPSTALVPSDLQFESPYSNFSLDFDGTNGYVDGNTASYLNATTTFTISTWFNTDTVAGTDKFLINIGGSSSELWGVQLYNGNLVVYGGSTSKNLQYNGLISINTWYSLALVYDGGQGAADRYKVYLNGVLLTPTTTVGTIDSVTPTFTNNLTIGKLAYSAAEYWNGKIDETAIWNTALTQVQVSQIYNNGYPADLTSLSPVSWWRLGEDAYFVSPNFTVPNQITGAPNGTSQNMDQADLVADAPGSYASGIGSSLVVGDRVGDAPESTANSLSINMTPLNKISYPSGYVPTQADNVYSMAFDGIDDYFSAPISSLNSATVCSISFWGKKDASNKSLCLGGFINNSNGIWINWYLDGNIYFSPRGSGAGSYFLTHAQSYDSNWHHYVGVYDGTSAANCKLYLDGNLVATGTGTPPASLPATTGDVFQIGALGTSFYTTGNIDEAAIFDYALSARQVKQDIYNGTTTGKTADLNNISNLTAPVAWYRMGD